MNEIIHTYNYITEYNKIIKKFNHLKQFENDKNFFELLLIIKEDLQKINIKYNKNSIPRKFYEKI